MKKTFYFPILEKKVVAEDTYEITLDTKGSDFSFTSGQYVWITIPEPKETDDRGDTRAFSIASSPEENKIRVVFRNPKDSSAFKRNILQMQTGEKLKILGPFGFFTIKTEEKNDLVFIAGGVGISPFLSIFKENRFFAGH